MFRLTTFSVGGFFSPFSMLLVSPDLSSTWMMHNCSLLTICDASLWGKPFGSTCAGLDLIGKGCTVLGHQLDCLAGSADSRFFRV